MKIDLARLRKDDIAIKTAPKADRVRFYRYKDRVLKRLWYHGTLKYVGTQVVGRNGLLHLYVVEGYPFHSRTQLSRVVNMLATPFNPVQRGVFYYRIGDKFSA